MVYALISADLPVPTGGTGPLLRSGCTDTSTTSPIDLPFYSGQTDFPLSLNQLLAVIATMGNYGGNTYGVINGLDIYAEYNNASTYYPGMYASSGSTVYQCILQTTGNAPPDGTYWTTTTLTTVTGLQIGFAPGVAVCQSQLEFGGGLGVVSTATAARVYAWLKQSPWNNLTKSSGTVDFTTTTTPPADGSVFLGSFPTSAGVVGQIDFSGVVYMIGGYGLRFTADSGAPTDTPSSTTTFYTQTSAGLYIWAGAANTYSAIGTTQSSTTTGTTTTLGTGSSPTQFITPTANIDVLLPLTPTSFAGIYNSGTIAAGFTITLKDSTGSYTYCVIQPGYFAVVPVVVNPMTGTPGYPPIIVPQNGLTGVSVLETTTGSVTGGASLSWNITSNGYPMFIVLAQDTNPEVSYSSITVGGASISTTPDVSDGWVGAGQKFVIDGFYVQNPPVGVVTITATLSAGTANIAGIARTTLAPAGSSLGTTNSNNANSGSSTVALTGAIGDLILDAIVVASGHTATTNQTADGTVAVGGIVLYASEAYGQAVSTNMTYTVAAAGNHAEIALVVKA